MFMLHKSLKSMITSIVGSLAGNSKIDSAVHVYELVSVTFILLNSQLAAFRVFATTPVTQSVELGNECKSVESRQR